ncbi:MAG: hypothetical protein AAFR65_15105 [Pseudomonadota bacterium]
MAITIEFDFAEIPIVTNEDWDALEEMEGLAEEVLTQLQERFAALIGNANWLRKENHAKWSRNKWWNRSAKAILFGATAAVGAFNLIDISSTDQTIFWDRATLFVSIFAAFVASFDGYFSFSRNARDSLQAANFYRALVSAANVAWDTRVKNQPPSYLTYKSACTILDQLVKHLNSLGALDPDVREKPEPGISPAPGAFLTDTKV